MLGLVLSELVLRFPPRGLLPKEFGILDRVYDARGACAARAAASHGQSSARHGAQLPAGQSIAYCKYAEALRAEAQKGRQLYHRISSHWNDAGNAVGAEVVVRCLSERGVLNGAAKQVQAAAVP